MPRSISRDSLVPALRVGTPRCDVLRRVFLSGLLILAAAAGGCQRGPKWNLVPVEGTVTKDGRPLGNVQVIFLADPDAGTQGPRATGTTDLAGRYRLRTDNGDDGAVVGKHRVILLDLDAVRKQLFRGLRRRELQKVAEASPENAKRFEEEQKKPVNAARVPSKYESFSKTPLRVEVGPKPTVFDIVIP